MEAKTDAGVDQQEEDATLSLERELASIEADAQAHRLQAFGPDKEKVLNAFHALREEQSKLFSDHLQLEISFRNIEPVHDFSSKQFCEHFPRAFQDKAEQVKAITRKLHEVADKITDIATIAGGELDADAPTAPAGVTSPPAGVRTAAGTGTAGGTGPATSGPSATTK